MCYLHSWWVQAQLVSRTCVFVCVCVRVWKASVSWLHQEEHVVLSDNSLIPEVFDLWTVTSLHIWLLEMASCFLLHCWIQSHQSQQLCNNNYIFLSCACVNIFWHRLITSYDVRSSCSPKRYFWFCVYKIWRKEKHFFGLRGLFIRMLNQWCLMCMALHVCSALLHLLVFLFPHWTECL